MKNITLPGIAMVAVTYALARLSFGLFLPEIAASLNLSESQSGFIGTLGYLSYVVALFSSSFFIQKATTCIVALTAGLSAVIGLTGMSLATNIIVLGLSTLIAGLGSGWSSTVYSKIVQSNLPVDEQDPANSWINTGTSFGVIVSGPIALLFTGFWRISFLFFAFLSLLTLIWNALVLPKPKLKTVKRSKTSFNFISDVRKARFLICAALVIGFSTSIYWTFSRSYLTIIYQWNHSSSILFWIVMGAAGIGGSTAGKLVQLKGLDFSFKSVLIILSLSISLLVFPPMLTIYLSAILFGVAYIAITGILLIWGTKSFPNSPDLGVSISFLSLGIGQTIGSSVAGISIEHFSYPFSFILFSLLVILALFIPIPPSASNQ
ncbi:MFS transporter [Marinilactibacillus sp. XAAS-LB27]|uniref:MFS transporter n=1 Tax=Marinilactibacillus sp. XAAS-LB27 TaxID=3114538 RepID=UPI002E16D338|nr:MFS transporter [Marinilactibacillus sp. XAAS-LB27]